MEKKTYIIKYAKCVLVLLVCIAAFFAIRPLFWRFITRPTDQIRTYTEYAERGEIFDCRDNLIATNKTVYDLHLDCCVLEDQKMSFPASGSFKMSQLFTSGGQSIGASASAAVLPVDIHG